MARGITLKVKGADSVISQLSAFGDRAGAANEAALTAAGLIIQSGAQKRSPRKTGRNAASISMEVTGSGLSAQAEIATGTEYGPYLELGTVKMAARPYLRPALREDAPAAQAKYAQVVKAALGL